MDSWTLSFTAPTALAAVALLGYLVGRRNVRMPPRDSAPSHPELKRARLIIRDLDTLASHLRQDLAQHGTSLDRCQEWLDEMSRDPAPANLMTLAAEAERLLGPTQE